MLGPAHGNRIDPAWFGAAIFPQSGQIFRIWRFETVPGHHHTIYTTGVNLSTQIPMPEKSLLESCRAFGIKEWAHVVFMVLIMCAGGYLIVYSVYMMTLNNDATMFMFAIAMFGVGCTTIWFALSHVEIQSTEEKLENITTRLDNIIKKIEKQ